MMRKLNKHIQAIADYLEARGCTFEEVLDSWQNDTGVFYDCQFYTNENHPIPCAIFQLSKKGVVVHVSRATDLKGMMFTI